MFEAACAALLRSDVEKQLVNAGLTYTPHKNGFAVVIPYFDEHITLLLPQLSFESSKGTNITLVAKIILLHYINGAAGVPLGAGKVPYEDIPGLRPYLPVFEKRVTKPLQTAFGYERDAFREAGMSLGAQEEEYGDASFTLFALPRVPITFILWEGVEEFRPSVRCLFDPSIPKYLPLEDITVISKLAAVRIVKEARKKYFEEVME